MLNAMQESSFRILCTEREVASDCLGSPYGTIRDYTYLYGEPGTAAITESHLQDSTVLLKDIYPSSMIVTVKCNSIRKSHLREVKPAFTTNCISFLQPIMEMHTMERVQIEIVDRGAALLYGNFIQIVNPFPEVLEGTEYARVRLERVILEGENNHAPVYWIKDAVPVPLSQQDFLKN